MKSEILSFVILVVILSGCTSGFGWFAEQAQTGNQPDAEAERNDANNYVGLVDALRESGANVEEAGSVSQPFFSVEGRLIRLNGADVQGFEFADAGAASAAAASIAPDGSSVGTSMMMWVEPPHFYQSGRLIVLYVGSDEATLSLLTAVLGEQIAGR